ncbi:MAG TPA: hypothetical protein VFM14_01755 [Gemmatimonadales bacterium]|nr:hypothetical protein [Gemmatimonadales bacterium]
MKSTSAAVYDRRTLSAWADAAADVVLRASGAGGCGAVAAGAHPLRAKRSAEPAWPAVEGRKRIMG